MTTRPLKVCLVSPLPPPAGGIAQWTQLVTGYLVEDPRLEFCLIDTALRLRTPHKASLCRLLLTGSVEAIVTLAKIGVVLFCDRPSVVHVNSSGQMGMARDVAAVTLARARGIPAVVHLHFGRVPDIARQRSWEWRLLSRLVSAASVVIAIDSLTADALRRNFPAVQVELVPNCVDLGSDVSGPNYRRVGVVLYAGWMIPSKGVEELLSAWSVVRRPGRELRLAGGFDPAYLADLRARLPFTDDVSVLGEIPHEELMAELRSCGVFVLPSHTEGFPNVVLEAMAAEAPIVATDVGAVPEILEEGTGIIVRPRDVAALVAGLERIMHDPEWAAGLGTKARVRVVEQYSLSRVAERYVALWIGASGRSA